MSSPSLVKLGLRIPENRSVKVPPRSQIPRRKRAKSSITSVDYSISLKFCAEFKRMTREVL